MMTVIYPAVPTEEDSLHISPKKIQHLPARLLLVVDQAVRRLRNVRHHHRHLVVILDQLTQQQHPRLLPRHRPEGAPRSRRPGRA